MIRASLASYLQGALNIQTVYLRCVSQVVQHCLCNKTIYCQLQCTRNQGTDINDELKVLPCPADLFIKGLDSPQLVSLEFSSVEPRWLPEDPQSPSWSETEGRLTQQAVTLFTDEGTEATYKATVTHGKGLVQDFTSS